GARVVRARARVGALAGGRAARAPLRAGRPARRRPGDRRGPAARRARCIAGARGPRRGGARPRRPRRRRSRAAGAGRGRSRARQRARASVVLYRTFLLRDLPAGARGRLRVPGRLVVGERDPVVRPSLLAGRERWADDLVIERVPGVGHWIPAERPDLVAERAL